MTIKKIKKRYKVLLLFLLLMLSLPAITFIFLQFREMQNLLLPFINNTVSEKLETYANIEEIDIKFFNRLELKNVLIKDLHSDTLISAEKISLSFKNRDKENRILRFKYIKLQGAWLNLQSDSANELNLDFFIEKLKSEDTSKVPWQIEISNIEFTQSRFSYSTPFNESQEHKIDFQNLDFSDLEINAQNFSKNFDTLNFDLNNLGFKDRSGFKINHLIAQVTISGGEINFLNPYLQTPATILLGDQIGMFFDSFKSFKNQGIISNVNLKLKLDPSNLSFHDISYFTKGLNEYDQNLVIAGEIRGRVNELKGRNMLVRFGASSELHGSFYLNGLPDVNNTYLFANIKELDTHKNDLEKIKLPTSDTSYVDLPESFNTLGDIRYEGNFTGFFDDFVAYGKFTTSLGTVISDLSLKPDTGKQVKFQGQLKCEDFDLGRFLNVNRLGKITLNTKLNGFTTEKSDIQALLEGNIKSLEFNEYNYKNIELDGNLAQNKFDGKVKVDDPNIELEFLGKFDYSKEIPVFDFTANVNRANIYSLKFNKTDPSYFASFLLKANFIGDNIDELNGEINLLNSFFAKKGKQIQIYDSKFIANNSNAHPEILFTSDFLDAKLIGKYHFQDLILSFKNYLYYYLPSLNDTILPQKQFAGNDFSFEIDFKNTDRLTDFFIPEISIAERTLIKGNYNPSNLKFEFTMLSPKIDFWGNTWNHLYFNNISNDSTISFISGSQSLILKNQISFDNLSLYTDVKRDSIELKIRWNNWDTVVYKGNMRAITALSRNEETDNTRILVDILPSEIILHDSLWKISPSKILVDSNAIKISDYTISKNNQYFNINGILSKKAEDSLSVNFADFNLSNLNILFKNKDLSLGGVLNGKASLSDFYQDPRFNLDLLTNDLQINLEPFGDMRVISKWDNNLKTIHIDAYSQRGNLRTIELKGDYGPKTRSLLFEIAFNKQRLNFVSPYLKNISSDIRGLVSGEAMLAGTLKKPVLNGSFNLQKTSFTIDYLQTRYNFTNKIDIVNNNVLFDKIKLFDSQGNLSYVNGSISSEYLRNFFFNITIDARKFMFLNTSPADNEDFYGSAFATGLVTINGPPNDLFMKINAKTENQTEFFIPLYSDDAVSEYHFINFVGNVENEYEKGGKSEDLFRVDLNRLRLNLDLEVTPDAEVQIIFDSKIGDIIKGTGSGNIEMEINTLGDFKMFGDYVIADGDYLFTLQNIINKRFSISEGGRISWTGDPTDANIDLEAIYKLKTGVYELLSGIDPDEKYKKRLPVECQLILKNKLMNPNIKFGINLPTADEETRSLVQNAINTEEELSKQFLSLLVLNSFMPDPNSRDVSDTERSGAGVASVVTTTELLSNQLSHWLSQISNDFDIGVNYRQDTRYPGNDLEVMLSTQLLNDRVTINGNIDMGRGVENPASQTENTNNIVGDFDLDVRITDNGKLRFKAFNKSNDYLTYDSSPYTQGIGLFYREEFYSIGELFRRYWNAVLNNREEEEERGGS